MPNETRTTSAFCSESPRASARDVLGTNAGRLCATLLLAAMAFSVWFHFAADVLPYDDAYITFRYADNVWAGRGPVYNPGERVFGSSSPLYCLWLVALRLPAGDGALPALAVRANIIFHLACVLGVAALTASFTARAAPALLAAALYAVEPRMLVISTGGMEAFLFVALVLWSLWALTQQRFRTAMLLAGLSTLSRPEGLCVLFLGLLVWLFQDRKRRFGVLACGFAPLLVWVAGASLYYGTPVPHSILAKSAPLYPLQAWSALQSSWRHTGEWLFPLGTATGQTARAWTGAILLIASVAGAVLVGPARRARAWLPGAILVLFLAAYALGNPKLFEWYLPHLHAAWFLTLVAGMTWFWHGISTRFRVSAPTGGGTIRPALSCLLVALAIPTLGVARSFVAARSPDGSLLDGVKTPMRLRTIAYQRAAEWLNEHSSSSTRIVSAEVGALGYHYRGVAIDACALVSPAALAYLPVPVDRRFAPGVAPIPTDLVRDTEPDFVVTLPIFSALSLDRSPWFQRNYKQVHTEPLPLPVWGVANKAVIILEKRAEP